MMSCTEEAMDLYRQSIWEELQKRLKGDVQVILDAMRDTIHIYIQRKGLRFDWTRQKVSDLIVFGMPAEVVAVEFVDKYHDYLLGRFFWKDGHRTEKVWSGYLARLRDGKVG